MKSKSIKKIAEYIKSKHPDGALICITGAGASGKTVLSKQLIEELGRNNAGHLEFDCFYIPDFFRRKIKDKHGETITGCHPCSINLELASKAIASIKKGIDTPKYAAYVRNGTVLFKKSGEYKCKKYNLIDGLAAVHTEIKLYDLLIFVECDLETEIKRRFSRDITERKKPADDIKKIFNIRRKQYEKYVLPFRQNAGIVVKSLENYEISINFIK